MTVVIPNMSLSPQLCECYLPPEYAVHWLTSGYSRHLGRPAHGLKVDNPRQCISSFNIPQNAHGHPRAGLCKTCWRSFTDPEVFESHVSASQCRKVARSKREKFDRILDTFCRTGDRASRDDLVGRSEFTALAARLTALEREFSQRMSQFTPRIMPSTTGALVSSMGPGIQPTQSAENYHFDSGAGPSSSRAAVAGSIVQSMGSGPVTLNQDTDRIMSGFGPSSTRRLGSMSTAQAGIEQGGPIDPTTTNCPVNVAGAAAAAAAAGGRGGGREEATGGGSDGDRHIGRPQAAEYGQEESAFESANSTDRNQWFQAVEASEDMLNRVDFFNPPQDDINRYYMDMDQ